MRVCTWFVFLCALFVLGCSPSQVATPVAIPEVWTSLNGNLPNHTGITALAAAPTNPKRIFAATYDAVGMYSSSDGGMTWQIYNTALPRAPVFALLTTPQELFAGTAAGLYRRAWNSQVWQRADPVPQVGIYSLALTSSGLWAATDGRGIWQSADRGTTWSRVPGLDDESILSLLPLDARTVLAGTAGHGLFVTRDAGASWQNDPTLGQAYVSFIVGEPQHPEILYARTRGGVFRSGDAGASWSKLDGIQHEVVNALRFDPTHMFAATAGGGILVSEDGGATWHAAQVDNPRKRAVLTLFRIDKTLYAGTAEGLLTSTDNGDSWTSVSSGPGAPILHGIEIIGDQIWVAAEDGVYRGETKGQWQRVDFGVNDTPVLALAGAPSDPQRIYLGTDGKGVFVSRDGGVTWSGAGGELGGRTHVSELAVDPTNPDIVFARILFERIYKSTNAGESWHTVWGGMPDEEQLQSMAIAPGNPTQMWAGGDTQLYTSTNSGQTWQPRGPQGISRLAEWIDPQDAQHVWVGGTNGLYISDDAGNTWRGPLLEGITVGAIAQDNQGNCYLGTLYNGIFISHDHGNSFTPFALEGQSVNALVHNPATNALIALTPAGLLQTVLP